jgi:hypothetical protein
MASKNQISGRNNTVGGGGGGISFTLTSRRRRYAGYHNCDYPYLTILMFHYIQTKLVPRRGLYYSDWLASSDRGLTGTRL